MRPSYRLLAVTALLAGALALSPSPSAHAHTWQDTSTGTPVVTRPFARADSERQLSPTEGAAVLAGAGCRQGGIVHAHTTNSGTVYVVEPPTGVDPPALSDHEMDCYGFGHPSGAAAGQEWRAAWEAGKVKWTDITQGSAQWSIGVLGIENWSGYYADRNDQPAQTHGFTETTSQVTIPTTTLVPLQLLNTPIDLASGWTGLGGDLDPNGNTDRNELIQAGWDLTQNNAGEAVQHLFYEDYCASPINPSTCFNNGAQQNFDLSIRCSSPAT